MASDTRRSNDLHVNIEPIDIRGERFWSYTFPTEPHWWIDQRQSDRRVSAIRDFSFEDLGNVTTELKSLVEHPLRLARRSQHTEDAEQDNVEEATRLVRRCLSLSWLVDVALEHLNGPSGLEGVEYMCRLNEIRSAQFLAETAWCILIDLQRPLVVAAIREAVARPDELYPDDRE